MIRTAEGSRSCGRVRAGLGSPQGPCNLRRHPLLRKPTPRPRHTKELTFALSIPRGNERIRWDPTGVDWKVCEVAQSSFQTSSLRMGPTEPSSPNRKHLVQAIFTPTEGRPLRGRGTLWDQRDSFRSREHGLTGDTRLASRSHAPLPCSRRLCRGGDPRCHGRGRQVEEPAPVALPGPVSAQLRTLWRDVRAGRPEPAGSRFPGDAHTGPTSR